VNTKLERKSKNGFKILQDSIDLKMHGKQHRTAMKLLYFTSDDIPIVRERHLMHTQDSAYAGQANDKKKHFKLRGQ
jgi:hypothetical protein